MGVSIAVDGQRNWHVVYDTKSGGTYYINYLSSTGTEDVIAEVTYDQGTISAPAIDVDSNEDLHVIYRLQDRTSGSASVMYTSSWSDAFNYLQDALTSAWVRDEIRVAQGIYNPDRGASITPGNRYATFQLINGVTIKGGYAGFGDPDPDARDINAYKTILSGDLNGDDGPNFTNNGENSCHVVTGSGTDTTAVLDGFSITGGNANSSSPHDSGGGMYNESGSPTVTNCTFSGNSAEYNGGGMFNRSGSPSLTNCTFSGNSANSGGGMYNYWSIPTLTNCTFSGNLASSNGGGIYNRDSSSPTLTNCTFSGNSANKKGGGMYNSGSSPMLTNCIVWGNTVELGPVTSCSQIFGGSPLVNYSCIQDEDPNDGTVYPGTGNIDENPLFVDPDGTDNLVGTEDDNLRLLPGSPCLDAGDNLAVPPSVAIDPDGDPRIANGIVDMGAYEGPDQGFLLSTELLTITEGQTAAFTVALVMDPLGTVEAAVAVEYGDLDITLESPALLTFDSSNYQQPQKVTVAAAEDADYFHGEALILISAPGFFAGGVTVTELDDEAPVVLYVDTNASGANNGTSWADGFTHLQDALSVARVIPEVEEIRIGQGFHTPDKGNGFTPGERTATFQLINGVTIKGGYAGLGEPDPNVRDIELYETILSGDLNGDDIEVAEPCDLLTEPTRAENSFHVVSADRRIDETAVLDGFIITSGNTNSGGYPDYEDDGGGLNISGYSNPTVEHCIFRANSANYDGGGMSGNGTLTDCKFIGNSAKYGGGVSGNGTLTDCKFIRNSAKLGGGVISNGTLTNCTFSSNSAYNGGGMYNNNGSPSLTNCTFSGNSAKYGGGMFNWQSTLTLFNCIFRGNSAGYGGGMYNNQCDLLLTNCTFAVNSALNGNALACDSWPQWDPSNLRVTNCILWDGGDEIWNNDNSVITITYSDVQGGWEGEGNIDADPCFISPGYWDANGVWIDGDYHLLPSSPCIDAGDPNYVAEPNETDLDGKPRVIGSRIDMGAYEYSPPVSAEVRIVPHSINPASKGKWINCYIWLSEDYDVVDIDPNSVVLEGKIEAQSLVVDEQQQVTVARFSRSEVQSILAPGEVELTVSGELSDGTRFEGNDMIRVIDKGRNK
jgi:parallel beta-helix repeat protein